MFLRLQEARPAHARAGAARPRHRDAGRRPAHRARHPAAAAPGRRACEVAYFGMGCFWGAERLFWRLPGVYSTAVGYAGRASRRTRRTRRPAPAGPATPRPSRSCTTRPRSSYEQLLKVVLGEPRPDPGHAPGQRRRHPVPVGDLRHDRRAAGRGAGVAGGVRAGRRGPPGTGEITTEIAPAGDVLLRRGLPPAVPVDAKNPNGYCNHGPNGMTCPDRRRPGAVRPS